MAKLNISQAARQWGKSRQTIYSYLEQGKLSGETDPQGTTSIDTSELLRVFGEAPIKRLKRSHSEHDNTKLKNEIG